MLNLLRKPLAWMVLAECAVVMALVLVAWHMVANASLPAVVLAPMASPSAPGDATDPVPADVAAQPKAPAPPLLPGLNVDPNFWRLRLAELNDGEKSFEVLEWRLVHAAMEAAHRYLETVVLPAVARAERHA